MSSLLEFEHEALLDVLNQNSLTISSKGLLNDRLLFNLVRTYCHACHLVFVIGAEPDEEYSIITQIEVHMSQLSKEKLKEFQRPSQVYYSINNQNRNKLYLDGGVLFISSQMLLIDMLDKRFPFQSVSGIIVLNAHRVLKDCHMSFILRLFRMKNKNGFITALSQNASSFLGSFGQLEKCIRQLFVGKLYLWPRFHANVCDSFANRKQPNLVEYRIDMSPIMKEMQFALINLISRCIKELSSMSTFSYATGFEINGLDEQVSFDPISVISNNFKLILKNLDSVWYQLSDQARRYIHDIRLLKNLLFKLTEMDAIQYYTELNAIREKVTPDSNPSDWLFWPDAEKLFTLANKQILKDDKTPLEINPKLTALEKLLKKIESKIEQARQNSSQTEEKLSIIIIVESYNTTYQIKSFFDKGLHRCLNELELKRELIMDYKFEKKSKTNHELNQNLNQEPNLNLNPDYEKDVNSDLSFDQTILTRKHELYELYFYEWSRNNSCSLGLKHLLFTLKPKIVILYQPEISCIRQIELYQALTASEVTPPLDVYFFIFDGSAEEQRYLRNLQVEKASFNKLIDEKLNLAYVKENEGIFGEHPDLVREKSNEIDSLNTRIGGLEKLTNQTLQVLVDKREFRSKLPGIIHKFGIDLEPVMLPIGDYIITPEACIERKAISDLIKSLNNGRLYSQTQLMTRFYKKPILLIEFPEDGNSFNFKSKHWGYVINSSFPSFSSSQPNPLLQLSCLTILFPLLRIIWSPSTCFTADIIRQLKQGKPNPNKDTDIISANSDQQLPNEYLTDRFDFETKEFLLCLPGINPHNVYGIMNDFKSIKHLLEQSVEELEEKMKSTQNARLLYGALHNVFNISNNSNTENKSASTSTVGRKNRRFTYVRKKPKK